MHQELPQPPRKWTNADAKELRLLAKYLKKVNAVAGVFDPSGGVVEGEKRLRYLKLARRLSEAMGGTDAGWANAVAWNTQTQEHAHD